MARKRTHIPLNVFLNARLVGRFSRESSGAVRFIYDDDWLNWEYALPISLSMPLREDQFTGDTVVAVFDNLLPDSELARRRVAERVGANGTDAFNLLSMIGRDCVGALQFLPDGEDRQPNDQLTGNPLTDDDIASLLNKLDVSPLGIRSEIDFRISVAGAQEKTALLFHDGQWIEPTGTTPTTHILKPQIGKLENGMDLSNSVENEFLCLKLMQAFGLDTAYVEMINFNKKRALVVERFDRQWRNGRLFRIPQEDCCQALSVMPTRKYQSDGGPGIVEIMDLLLGSDEPTRDRRDFFKTQIIFWLIGATDGHAKNFSLALSSQGRFRITPLYDVLTLQPTLDARQVAHKDFKLAMKWGKSGKYNVEYIHRRHFMQTGQQAGLSQQVIGEVIEEVIMSAETAITKTVEALPQGFPAQLHESLSSAMKRRLLRL